MKRPGTATYLFGNPVSATLVALLTLYLGYEWWRGEAPGLVVLLALVAVVYVGNANGEIEKYRAWKREWDALSGAPSRSSPRILRYSVLRPLIAIAIWCAFAFFAIGAAKQPGAQVPVALFWIGSLFLVVRGAYRLVRRVKPKKVARDIPVTVCLAVPRQSPTPAQAFAALPDYCRPLFADRAEPKAPIPL